MSPSQWPSLNYDSWKDTCTTLHLWTQIIGKIRLCKEYWVNHSWTSTLYVTPRGLGTSNVSNGDKSFSIEFDFIKSQLRFLDSSGKIIELPLQSESVAEFYQRVQQALKELEISTNFDARPNELEAALPFSEDTQDRVYEASQAYTFWQVLVRINNVMNEFRSKFVGKSSPVHFFWGSFDLALTRFSGKTAPEHPGGVPHLADKVVKEAYSHEVSSCGFWPGSDAYPNASFYAYAYPEPKGYSTARVEPPEAFYHQDLKEFLLPYNAVQTSQDPAQKLLSFLESTYTAAASHGKWNRPLLEESPYLKTCQEMFE